MPLCVQFFQPGIIKKADNLGEACLIFKHI